MRAVAALLLAGLAACGPEGDDAPLRMGSPLASVRDSAGVEVVEIDLERARRVVRARPEPEWIVGAGPDEAVEEGPALHDVADARLLADGTVAIAEGSTQEIVLTDPVAGTHVRIGGEGDGPAEFRGLAAVFDAGQGRVGAFDHLRLRYVVLSPQGELLSETRLPRLASGSAGRRFLPLDDGGYLFVHLPGVPETAAPEGTRPGGAVTLVRGEAVDTVVRIAGRLQFRGARRMGAVPFGPTTVVARGAGGLWIGDTAERAVELRGLDGTLRRVVRWRFERSLALSDGRVDSLVEAAAATVPEAGRDRGREAFASLPFPEREPAFGGLMVDTGDRLWIGEFVEPEVRLYGVPRPARQWLVLTGDGRPLGMGVTPEGLRVTEIGRERVLGVHTDSLGVETVRLHRLGSP